MYLLYFWTVKLILIKIYYICGPNCSWWDEGKNRVFLNYFKVLLVQNKIKAFNKSS